MKINDVKNIINISTEEWDYYSQLIENNLMNTIVPYISLSKNKFQTISIYSLYPLMFRKEFLLTDKNLDDLIVFSHHHFTSLFILDKLYDSQNIESPIDLLVLLEQYAYSRKFMLELKNSRDRIYISDGINKTLNGLYKEKYIYKYNKTLPLNEEATYVHDKYCFAKIALIVYNNRTINPIDATVINNLCISHDYFAYGRQILDDLEDFNEDYKNKQFNIYTNRYFTKYKNKDLLEFDSTIFQDLLSEANEYFEKSLNYSSNKFPYWENYIRFYAEICERYLNK